MRLTTICALQGPGLESPLAGHRVRVRGVVTGGTRKGYFIQDPGSRPRGREDCSCAVFVFSRRDRPRPGSVVEVEGEVIEFRVDEHDRPTTQLVAGRTRLVSRQGPRIEPVWLDAAFLDCDNAELARRLNQHEGMLMGIEAGAEFVAPSNPFGDYVLLPPGDSRARTPHGGVLIDPAEPDRWLPSFRITDYERAPRLNVGARLLKPVVGPLNYRANAYQLAARTDGRFRLEFTDREVDLPDTRLRPGGDWMTVLTLNGFNLDPQVERADRVKDPGRDIDDDLGDGRYDALARDVVHRAGAPDLVALQEIQDDDGAEITDTVDATRNYRELAGAIRRLGGPDYVWADLAPVSGADGGQPGGNIRNGFLYDPGRLELVEGSLRRLGETDAAFVESRKPVLARFRHRASARELVVLNVHLASKRHQHPIFSPDRPGFDPREQTRIAQARLIREELLALGRAGLDYYVTGDFNDFEFSPTLRTVLGEESVNLVETLPVEGRYDYNHRGTSEALLHAIVPRAIADAGRARYEVLHGNELIGVTPGTQGQRATDHAYAVARIAF